MEGIKGFAVGANYEVCEVDSQMAQEIIKTREPLGLFLCDNKEEGKIIGIDNRTGGAWTGKFHDLEECINWLCDSDKEMREPDIVGSRYRNMADRMAIGFCCEK